MNFGTPTDLRTWLAAQPPTRHFTHRTYSCVIAQYLTAHNGFGLVFCGTTTCCIHAMTTREETYRLPRWITNFILAWDAGFTHHSPTHALAVFDSVFPELAPPMQPLTPEIEDNTDMQLPAPAKHITPYPVISTVHSSTENKEVPLPNWQPELTYA